MSQRSERTSSFSAGSDRMPTSRPLASSSARSPFTGCQVAISGSWSASETPAFWLASTTRALRASRWASARCASVTKRAGSKLTLVMVAKSASATNTSAAGSLRPSARARTPQMDRPLSK